MLKALDASSGFAAAFSGNVCGHLAGSRAHSFWELSSDGIGQGVKFACIGLGLQMVDRSIRQQAGTLWSEGSQTLPVRTRCRCTLTLDATAARQRQLLE